MLREQRITHVSSNTPMVQLLSNPSAKDLGPFGFNTLVRKSLNRKSLNHLTRHGSSPRSDDRGSRLGFGNVSMVCELRSMFCKPCLFCQVWWVSYFEGWNTLPALHIGGAGEHFNSPIGVVVVLFGLRAELQALTCDCHAACTYPCMTRARDWVTCRDCNRPAALRVKSRIVLLPTHGSTESRAQRLCSLAPPAGCGASRVAWLALAVLAPLFGANALLETERMTAGQPSVCRA